MTNLIYWDDDNNYIREDFESEPEAHKKFLEFKEQKKLAFLVTDVKYCFSKENRA